MKYKGSTVILIVMLFITSVSMAQETMRKAIPLMFLSNNFSDALFPSSSFFLVNTASSRYKALPNAIDKQVHYAAFFCKMEVKNQERYNILLKLHAGDYDNYSKGYNEK